MIRSTNQAQGGTTVLRSMTRSNHAKIWRLSAVRNESGWDLAALASAGQKGLAGCRLFSQVAEPGPVPGSEAKHAASEPNKLQDSFLQSVISQPVPERLQELSRDKLLELSCTLATKVGELTRAAEEEARCRYLVQPCAGWSEWVDADMMDRASRVCSNRGKDRNEDDGSLQPNQVISSADLLYRMCCLFKEAKVRVQHSDDFKCVWAVGLQHKATSEVAGFVDYKGAMLFRVSQMPPHMPAQFQADWLELLNLLCDRDCPHPFGLVAGTYA
ncbi:hypothetical protein WJX72_004663 [[Myrmecia] bisecta]|uniref:Uncharacterized protein n=1 Tax=[Myrmecia] bisecta TaxID=41462 RepID=A0AAW1R6F2_9CHLO